MTSPKMNGYNATRKLVIMRHAERIDHVFGSWIPTSFDENGLYIRNNLNMPKSLPHRQSGPKGFQSDSPITSIGQFQAHLAGEALKESGLEFSHVFSSSALRCIETCAIVLKSAGMSHLPINVEPGLFECFSIWKGKLPVFMETEELKKSNFNVSQDYNPVISVSNTPSENETHDECYDRHYIVTKEILQKYDGNLLFVAHSTNLDSCSRQLTGKPARPEEERLALRAWYTSVALVEEDSNGKWHIAEPPILPFKHHFIENYEWRQLIS